MTADNEVINKVIETILKPVLLLFKGIINLIFINQVVALFFFFIFANILAIVLMKRDKMYAEKGQRRIRESTLLTVALVGGSIGMYFAMFKYKHKTLHTKFVVGVPVIICLQCALITCLTLSKFLLV